MNSLLSAIIHNVGFRLLQLLYTKLVADPEIGHRIQVTQGNLGSTFWILPGVWVLALRTLSG